MPVDGYAVAVAEIAVRVEAARKAGRPVAWIAHNNGAAAERFRPDSWGAELSPELEPVANEPLFVKTVFGAFTGTELGSWLDANGATGIELVGFLTHMCVSTTVRDALDFSYASTVVADACASRDLPGPNGVIPARTVHEAELAALGDRFAGIFTAAQILGTPAAN